MLRIAPLAQEFFANVLYNEEPLFVSDEATIWGVLFDDYPLDTYSMGG